MQSLILMQEEINKSVILQEDFKASPSIIDTILKAASLVAQLVKDLPATQETWVQSLGWEDPPEKGKATHSSILAWRILWTV